MRGRWPVLTLSRTRTRLSTWLTYLLAASVLSIIPSALWLPTSPASATTQDNVYSNVTLPNSTSVISPNSTTTIGGGNWLNTTNLNSTNAPNGIIVYVALRNPSSSSEYLNFSSWTGITVIDDWFNGAAPGTSNTSSACSACSAAYTTQGNFQNIIFTATSVGNANAALGALQLITPATVGTPYIWVGASASDSSFKYYWGTRHFYHYNSNSDTYANVRTQAQTYPTLASYPAGMTAGASTSNGYVGQSGYLATIVDAGENSIAGSANGTSNSWIGATDQYQEGVFEWDRNGGSPEAGSVLTYSTTCGVTATSHSAAPYSSGTPVLTFTSPSGCGGSTGMTSYTTGYTKVPPSNNPYTNGYGNHSGNAYAGSNASNSSGYSNWATGEPNNSSGTNAENAANLYGSGNSYTWNDLAVTSTLGYSVEFGSGFNDFAGSQPGPGMAVMAIASSGATAAGGLLATDFYMGERNTLTVNTGASNQSNEIVTQGQDSYGFFGGSAPAITTNQLVCGSSNFTETNFNWSSAGADPTSGSTCTQATQWIQHDYGYFTVPGKYDGSTTASVSFQLSGKDDGASISIGGAVSMLGTSASGYALSCWADGCTQNYTTLTLYVGRSYPIDFWYYNNGGASAINLGAVISTFNGGSAVTLNTTYGAQMFSTTPRFMSITTPSGASLTATAGTAYSLSETVSGAIGTVTYSYTGNLPSGLNFSSSTGAISGTPTVAGTAAITVTATDANGNSATTNSFTISVVAGALSAQAKTQVISSSSGSGATIATQPIITLVDAYNNTITTDNGNVTASIYSGANGTLGGTTTVAAVFGVATFTNLVLNGVNGRAYVLQFTHTGISNIYETVTATTGTATQVVLGTPANVTTAAGALLAQQPIAYIEDSGGNIVNTAASVSMAITAGVGGSISGTTTVSAVAGTASFSGISIGGVAGTQYGFLFSSGSLTTAGANITVYAGTANSIALTTQPAGYPNGAAAIVQPVVSLTDSFGNIANNNSDTITATVSAGATLTGTTSVVTSSGSATFTNLGVSGTPGSQYTLTFTNSLTNKTVSQTQVVPGSATDTAMTFDGSSTYAITSSLTTAQASNTTFTSEVWANPASGTCTNQQVIWERNTLGGSNASNYGWSLFCQSSTWYAAYYNTNTSAWGYITLGPVELGQWQHLAFTFTSSSWAFVGYINGIMTVQATISNTTTFNSTSTPIEVGGNGSSSLNFNGMIDEFKFWSVIRTSTQIASDMNAWGPVAANNGLVLYYDFNDVTPSTIFDKAWGAVTAENLTLSGSYSMVDMKNTQTCKLSNHTCIAFTRTYLNPFGGYQVPSTVTSASVLVVGGGGGGTAQTDNTGWVGGGGGAGGYQVFNSTTLTPSSYVPVVVGSGGYGGIAADNGWGLGLNGGNSQFGSLTASVGGGAGGGKSAYSSGTVNAANGGSGGGGGTYYTSTGGHGGLATSGQGNVGGNALATCCGSGGGGGSSGAGAYPTSNTTPALGGVGTQNPFVGSAYLAAGGNGAGGSGTGYYTNLTSSNGSVGTGLSAAANTGSGGGGGGGGGSPALAAGAGGSGVVLLEYITALPIVANPVNESATVATTTTFYDTNTAVTGLTRTFTWQYSSNGGTSWATAPNGTATYGTPSGSAGSGQVLANGSYVTPTLTNAMNNYQYRVVVVDTDSYGVTSTTTTSAATLNVNPAIVLITTPGSAVYGVSTGGGTAGYIQVQTGTGTGPFTFALNPTSSKYSLDTSTASSGFVNLVSLTSPAGTNYETVTVTDSSGATATGVIITTVTAAPTTTSFVAGAAFYNQPDTLTATVAESTVLTTAGTVTFKDSSNNVLCTTSTFNASDQASCAWTPASINTYVITAYFVDGAGNFASSQSGATSISPGKASITESVSASTAAVAGATGANALQITATLNPTGSVSPGGTVAFTVNGANACLAASVSNSIATCSYTAQGAGIQSISAVYSGDSTFNGANASTTTTISSCNVTSTGLTYTTSAPAAGFCGVQFTSGTNGSWTVPVGVVNAQVLVVGGGGGGGYNTGGGGSGGQMTYTALQTFNSSPVSITVGAGGTGGVYSTSTSGTVGGISKFGATTAAGGNPGTNYSGSGIPAGGASVSGSGAGGNGAALSNAQRTLDSTNNGSAGPTSTITGTSTNYGGGGGGGAWCGTSPYGSGSGGSGGLGGGGAGGLSTSTCSTSDVTTFGSNGTPNTGGGGGGSSSHVNGGAGGSGVVIVKYLSPSVITTNWDASGDTTTVTSGTSLTLAETATVFTFTRTTSWQYSVDGGTTWSLETATATAGANSSSGNSSPTLSYTFVIRCGLNTGTCKSATTQYLFRAMVIDTDTVTNLVTDSFSPTITVNVTALPFASLLSIISTSATYIANSPFTLATSGGGGSGAITYSLSGTGTASGCAITGAALRTTSTGTCKVIAVQAGDLDYVVETTTVTTINFYTYISYVNQYTAPVGSHGIGGGVSGGGINNTQTTGSTVITITGMTPTSGAAQTLIVVTGTNFQTGGISKIASISFNFGLDPVSFVVNSPTQLTITLPGGEIGVVDQFAIQPVSGAIVYTPTFTGLAVSPNA